MFKQLDDNGDPRAALKQLCDEKRKTFNILENIPAAQFGDALFPGDEITKTDVATLFKSDIDNARKALNGKTTKPILITCVTYGLYGKDEPYQTGLIYSLYRINKYTPEAKLDLDLSGPKVPDSEIGFDSFFLQSGFAN